MVRAEQHMGPGGRFSVGGSAHSVVQPIESWQLTNIEASLAAFLLHEDYRDYYKREVFAPTPATTTPPRESASPESIGTRTRVFSPP